MLALALALRARGHEPSFLAPDNFLAWIRGFGFDAIGNGIDVEALLRTAGAHFDSARWQMRHFAEVMVPAQFASFAHAPAVDLIVGSGVQFAGASVAEARDIPYVTAAFCPCQVPSALAPPPTVRTQTLPRWVNRAIWFVGQPIVERLTVRLLDTHRRALGLRYNDSPGHSLFGDHIIVAADCDLAPVGDDVPEFVEATDAWILHEQGALTAELDDYLSIDPPPIYVGFGSMVAARADDLARHAIAAIRAIGGRALIAGGWAGLDRVAGGADDVFAARAIPHAAVFPRVAAVVHHGGAGTTTSAAIAGRPQVVLPHVLDQFYWARRVDVIGIGPRPLPVSLVTADVLAERLDAAVNDPRISTRAARIGDGVRERNGVDAAVDLLEQYTG